MHNCFFLRILFLLFLISENACAYAQNEEGNKIDSLLKEEQNAVADSLKINLLVEVAYAYINTKPDEVIKYAEQALAISKKNNWTKGIARSLEIIGRAYWKKRKFNEALALHLNALQLYRKLEDKPQIAILYNYTGQDYADSGNYQAAIKYFTLAMKTYEEVGDKAGVARSHTLLGWVFRNQGKYAEAAANNYAAYKLFEKVGDKLGLAISGMDIGSDYENNGNNDEALKYYRKGVKEFDQIHDNIRASNGYNKIGNIYRKTGNFTEALKYHHIALKIGEEIRNQNNIGSSFAYIGDVYMSQGNYILALTGFVVAEEAFNAMSNKQELANLYTRMGICNTRIRNYGEAKKNLDKSMNLSKELDSKSKIADCLEGMTMLDSAMGKWKDAFEHQRQLIASRDSIYSIENARQMVQIQMQREFDREIDVKNEQIEIDKLKVAQKRNINLLLGGGLIILGIVIIFLIREKNKSDKLHKSLQGSLSEKEVLMKEIHHRVKNNLQVISSLLRLQASTVDDTAAKEALTESQNRVLSIALIHQKLYQDEKTDKIEFGTFADELFEQVKKVFGRTVIPVRFINSITNSSLTIDSAVPLGLILNELITNSFKYAFVNNIQPMISIDIKPNGDHYQMIYYDNGSGLPAKINFEKSETLGLKLINRLSKQLKGNAIYKYENGCKFYINFIA